MGQMANNIKNYPLPLTKNRAQQRRRTLEFCAVSVRKSTDLGWFQNVWLVLIQQKTTTHAALVIPFIVNSCCSFFRRPLRR